MPLVPVGKNGVGRLEFGRASWIPVLIAPRTLGLSRPAIDHSKTAMDREQLASESKVRPRETPRHAMVGRTSREQSSSRPATYGVDQQASAADDRHEFILRFYQPTALLGRRHDLLGESRPQELVRGFERRDLAGAFLESGLSQKKQNRVEDSGHDTWWKMRGVVGSSTLLYIAERTAVRSNVFRPGIRVQRPPRCQTSSALRFPKSGPVGKAW